MPARYVATGPFSAGWLGVPHAVLVVLTFLSIVLDQILQACTTIDPITQPRMLSTEHMHMHAGFESDPGRSWQVTGKDQLAFYLMPARFWQLCSGAPHHACLHAYATYSSA